MISTSYNWDRYKYSPQIQSLLESLDPTAMNSASGLARGGGASAYERGGDARRKSWIQPLKETDLGVAQAFFDP